TRSAAKDRNNPLDEIHRPRCQGLSQSEIASQLGMSQPQISRELETIARLLSPKAIRRRPRGPIGCWPNCATQKGTVGCLGVVQVGQRNLNKREGHFSSPC